MFNKTASLPGLFWFFALAGCNHVNLSPLEQVPPLTSAAVSLVNADFCTLSPDEVTINLKFLFIVDYSGSNASTDPTGARRFNAILQIVNSKFSQPTSFGLIEFSDAATILSNFTSDKTVFSGIVQAQQALNPHNGGTNYVAALTDASAMIQADITAARKATVSVPSQYVIFFISDGGANEPADASTAAAIVPYVDAIVALQTTNPDMVESIQLNTGYYNDTSTPDQVAQDLMTQMATHGLGQFHDFEGLVPIDLTQYTIPHRKQRHVLKDVMVRNINTLWKGGKLLADSDADGLSDEDEIRLGSDPQNPDSDGNGVGDGVEYYLHGSPCQGAHCEARLAAPYVQCHPSGPTPTPTPGSSSGTGTTNVLTDPFLDPFGDGLNRCERQMMGLDPTKFDNNLDWISDALALRSGIAMLWGDIDSYLDFDSDGKNNYDEVKANTPVDVPNTSIKGLQPYTYDLKIVSDDDTQTCYHLEVHNVSALSPNDKVRMYVMEYSPVATARRVFGTATVPLTNGLATFQNSDLVTSSQSDAPPGSMSGSGTK